VRPFSGASSGREERVHAHFPPIEERRRSARREAAYHRFMIGRTGELDDRVIEPARRA
jgi:hypothetical protein